MPHAIKIEDFQSEKFQVITLADGFYFIRKRCNETETGQLQDGYRELKRIFRKSRSEFDKACNGYVYAQLL